MSGSADGAGALQERIASLRSEGAWRLDPARFFALEALARRMAGQPQDVQRLLQPKLHAGIADFTQRLQAVQPRQTAPSTAPRSSATGTALGQLNAYLREATRAARREPGEEPGADDGQLASARRFRQAWERAATIDRVERAVSRKPANAGPLNSHVLVLRTLDLMRELSPEYLRRFVGYTESLQWLEQARPVAKAAAAAAPATRSRRKK